MCMHPKSFDKKGNPMFVMLSEEPEHFCGIRRRQFFSMMSAAAEAKGQVEHGLVDMTKPLPPGVIINPNGSSMQAQVKAESNQSSEPTNK